MYRERERNIFTMLSSDPLDRHGNSIQPWIRGSVSGMAVPKISRRTSRAPSA